MNLGHSFADDLIECLEAADASGANPFDIEVVTAASCEVLNNLTALVRSVEDVDSAHDELEVTVKDEGEGVEVVARLIVKAKVWTNDVQTVTFTLLRYGFDFRTDTKAFVTEMTVP